MTSSSIKPSGSIELNTPKLELPKSNPDTSEFDSKPDETSSAQSSPPQPLVSLGASSLNLGPSVPSKPASEPSTGLFTTSSPALSSSSKPEQPSPSPPAISDPVDGVGTANDNSDVMEEEAPDTSQLTLGNLGGFGLGTAPNPFGAPFGNPTANTPIPCCSSNWWSV